MSVTVAEVLTLPAMRSAVVVGGRRRLENRIRWVHVSEWLDIARFLKGGELLLSTGMALRGPAEQQIQFIRDLAARGVAGLAIASGRWLQRVPPPIIDAAEEAGLPVLFFTHEVPFIQITEEIHSLLVNRQYAQLRQAESVARQLNGIALRQQDANALLRILYQVLKNPVACVPLPASRSSVTVMGSIAGQARSVAGGSDSEPLVCYPAGGQWGEALLARVAQMETPAPGTAGDGSVEIAPKSLTVQMGRRKVEAWLQPIVVAEECWGYLAVVQSSNPLGDVERLVVDRAAVTLAYDILRQRSLRDQHLARATEVADSVLAGYGGDLSSLYRSAQALGHQLENRWLAVGVIDPGGGSRRPDLAQKVAAACRQHVLGCLPTWKQACMRLLLYAESEAALNQRLGHLARTLEAAAAGEPDSAGLRVGFSRPHADVGSMPLALREAEFTLALRARAPGSSLGPMFADTGIYKLLAGGTDLSELRRFAAEELQPLLRLPAEESEQLQATLRALLDNQLSATNTARDLGMSRQAVYQRRVRIEEAFGFSLDEPERRLALELALRAAAVDPLLVQPPGA